MENINICSDHSPLQNPNLERAPIFPELQRTLDDPLGISRKTHLLWIKREGLRRYPGLGCLWLLQLQTISRQHGEPPPPCLSLSVSSKRSHQSAKPVDTSTSVFQAEGGRDGLRVSPWRVWLSAELNASFYQILIRKKKFTKNHSTHHWSQLGHHQLEIPPVWF